MKKQFIVNNTFKRVRTRFAPSPTGAFHIGSARTALYNYLFARSNDGDFLLRIEDTDQTRFVPNAEKHIIESLKWLGITIDEGYSVGGEYGPYKQSERTEVYKKYAQQLVDSGKAYYAFDTQEALDLMREKLKSSGVPSPQYNASTRNKMLNSLTLSQDETKRRISNNEPYVIRIKIPEKENIRFYDMVRGWIIVDSSTLDDKILIKSDGMPTYHMANVVDDYTMKISHVIRGEEWLPSTPMHILLYRYLEIEESMPSFAHLPLLLKPDGNGKLSKRDAEQYGFPIFPLSWEDSNGKEVLGFKEHGYIPEALVNFLALLGWSPKNDKEVFNIDELIRDFRIENITKSGVKFDIKKAQWFNQQYLKSKKNEEIAAYLREKLDDNAIKYGNDAMLNICEMVKQRAVFMNDIWEQSKFFFYSDRLYIDDNIKGKIENNLIKETIHSIIRDLSILDDYSANTVKSIIKNNISINNLKINDVMPLVRLAVTYMQNGPDLSDVISILGKEEVIYRLNQAINIWNL